MVWRVRLAASISQPIETDQLFSVWENKDPQAFAHLPLDIRLKYAELYDLYRTTSGIVLLQNEVWKKLAPFEEAGPLSLDDRRQTACVNFRRPWGHSHAMMNNWPMALRLARSLGIGPKMLPEIHQYAKQIPHFELCKSI